MKPLLGRAELLEYDRVKSCEAGPKTATYTGVGANKQQSYARHEGAVKLLPVRQEVVGWDDRASWFLPAITRRAPSQQRSYLATTWHNSDHWPLKFSTGKSSKSY